MNAISHRPGFRWDVICPIGLSFLIAGFAIYGFLHAVGLAQ